MLRQRAASPFETRGFAALLRMRREKSGARGELPQPSRRIAGERKQQQCWHIDCY